MTLTRRIRKRFSGKNDVTLYEGDCLGLLGQIPDASVQLVVTSPPYNIGKSYEKKRALQQYLELQNAVIAECIRVVRPGGSICWQVGSFVGSHNQVIPLDVLLHPLFAKYETTDKLRLRNRIVWQFEHGLHCSHRFSGRYETVLWYTKGDRYKFRLDRIRVPQKYPGKRAYKGPNRGKYSGNPLGKNPGDLWTFPNVKCNHIEKTEHPCQFPIELPSRLILALSDRGDLVLDPFLGVGTTAVAALIHGRRSAGAELVREYLLIAQDRLRKAARGVLPYRRMNKPVYVPPAGTRLTTPPPHFRLQEQRGLRAV